MSLSRSKPFFGTKPSHRARPLFDSGISDEDFKKLHWSKQLELRPLGSRKRWVNDANIDFDNLTDNWDIDPDREE